MEESICIVLASSAVLLWMLDWVTVGDILCVLIMGKRLIAMVS